MATADLVIVSDRIVRPDRIGPGAIAIREGRILAVTDGAFAGPTREVLDATGSVVLPGLIDPHVHMRDPGLTDAEDWLTGTRAAAAGGVTTVLDHPNTIPPASTVEGFTTKREIAASRAVVDFGLHAGAGEGNLDQLEGLAAAGATAFKTYLWPHTAANFTGCCTGNDGVLHDLFVASARTGLPHNVHAESHPLIEHFTQHLLALGRRLPVHHEAMRPIVTEVEAFARAMVLAGAAGARLNLVHASSGSAVDLVRVFRETGLVRVTVETCPHYLVLTCDRLEEVGPYAKVMPPLRAEEERARLWELLVAGEIDTIGSDHAPHPIAAIEAGWQDITLAPGGSPGIELLLPVLLTHVHAGRLDLPALARLTAENVARLYGLYPQKGVITVGADADLVVVDPHLRRIVGRYPLYTKDPRTCRMFDGMETIGAPVTTILRGRVVMRDGAVVGVPGGGRFVTPRQA
jgi:allantoinase